MNKKLIIWVNKSIYNEINLTLQMSKITQLKVKIKNLIINLIHKKNHNRRAINLPPLVNHLYLINKIKI